MLICNICGDVITGNREPVQMVTHVGASSKKLYNRDYIREPVDLCYKCKKKFDEIHKHAVEEAELTMYQNRAIGVNEGRVTILHDGKPVSEVVYDHTSSACMFRENCAYPGTCKECIDSSCNCACENEEE